MYLNSYIFYIKNPINQCLTEQKRTENELKITEQHVQSINWIQYLKFSSFIRRRRKKSLKLLCMAGNFIQLCKMSCQTLNFF